jgi:hypothetical protein
MENRNYEAKIKTIWEKIWQKGGRRQKKSVLGANVTVSRKGKNSFSEDIYFLINTRPLLEVRHNQTVHIRIS